MMLLPSENQALRELLPASDARKMFKILAAASVAAVAGAYWTYPLLQYAHIERAVRQANNQPYPPTMDIRVGPANDRVAGGPTN